MKQNQEPCRHDVRNRLKTQIVKNKTKYTRKEREAFVEEFMRGCDKSELRNLEETKNEQK